MSRCRRPSTSRSTSSSSSAHVLSAAIWPMRPPTAAAISARMAVSPPVLRIARVPALLRPVVDSDRIRTNRSPMAETTACAASQAVVTAPTIDDAARPGQRLPAIGADVALPSAVVDFAECREHAGARVAVGRQDAGHVLDDEHAAVADLAQQSAGRFLGAAPAAARPTAARPRWRMVLVTCAPAPVSACTVSVLAPPGPATISSHNGSPGRRSEAAAAAIAALTASRSYSLPSHFLNTAERRPACSVGVVRCSVGSPLALHRSCCSADPDAACHAGVDAGLHRCLDGMHSLVGNIAVRGHGLDQRGLNFGARDPAARRSWCRVETIFC